MSQECLTKRMNSPSRLEPVAPSVFEIRDRVGLGFGCHLPVRATAVRRTDGTVWLHSPVALSDADAAALEALGPVRDLVAPNRMHHLHVAAAKARFPSATVWAPAGLEAKVGPGVVDRRLTEEAVRAAWGGDLLAMPIDGAPRLSEWVFLHEPSKTLIAADLVFNLDDRFTGPTRWLLRCAGTLGKLARSRAWALFVRDRDAHADSLRRLLRWDFERIVPAHGEVVRDAGRARLAEVLAPFVPPETPADAERRARA